MTNNNPTVSVIIPTYNRAYILPRAIKSALEQTFQDLELIVVDDGSIDNTEEVVRKFQKKDRRVKYIKHKENRDTNLARNTGLRIAKGKYVAFLDSDDEWLPENLEKKLKVFGESNDKNLGFVYSGAYLVNKKSKKTVKMSFRKRGFVLKDLLLSSNRIAGGSNNLIKREVFDNCGFFDESGKLERLDDTEMWIRIAKKYKFDFVNECLIRYFVRNSQTFSSRIKLENKIIALEYILDKFLNDYKKYPWSYSGKLRGIGTHYLLADDFKTARKYFIEAIKKNWLDPRPYINLIISFLGKNLYKKFLYQKGKITGNPYSKVKN